MARLTIVAAAIAAGAVGLAAFWARKQLKALHAEVERQKALRADERRGRKRVQEVC